MIKSLYDILEYTFFQIPIPESSLNSIQIPDKPYYRAKKKFIPKKNFAMSHDENKRRNYMFVRSFESLAFLYLYHE